MMDNNKTMAFLGLGNRGYIYAKLAKETGKVKITSICDLDAAALKTCGDYLEVKEELRFSSPKDFFKQGKLADVLVISTPDASHYENCMDALKVGYDVVLEKPVAVTRKQCEDILALSQKMGRKVVVCHVLRYTNFFNQIKKILLEGRIGRIIHYSHSENVGWWHYTQSFVRGKWRNSESSTPMILAKCCHDFDIINWLMDEKCVSLSSMGGLDYFKEENAPEGCAKNCVDCKYSGTCLYSAIPRSKEMPGTMNVPYGFEFTDKEIEEYLSDRDNQYGKCVYRTDNNVVDHQSVVMRYESGATVTMNMHAFAQETYRHVKITGTLGELDAIFAGEDDTYIELSVNKPIDKFKKERQLIDTSGSGHGGGDRGFVYSIIDYFFYGKQNPDISSLEVSMASHIMAFAAEESRLNGGKPEKF